MTFLEHICACKTEEHNESTRYQIERSFSSFMFCIELSWNQSVPCRRSRDNGFINSVRLPTWAIYYIQLKSWRVKKSANLKDRAKLLETILCGVCFLRLLYRSADSSAVVFLRWNVRTRTTNFLIALYENSNRKISSCPLSKAIFSRYKFILCNTSGYFPNQWNRSEYNNQTFLIFPLKTGLQLVRLWPVFTGLKSTYWRWIPICYFLLNPSYKQPGGDDSSF